MPAINSKSSVSVFSWNIYAKIGLCLVQFLLQQGFILAIYCSGYWFKVIKRVIVVAPYSYISVMERTVKFYG